MAKLPRNVTLLRINGPLKGVSRSMDLGVKRRRPPLRLKLFGYRYTKTSEQYIRDGALVIEYKHG